MDDDARRKRLQLGFNVGQVSLAAQLPQTMYRLNAVSGQLEAQATIGEGVNFFSDNNSQPQAAPRQQSNARDFSDGGASVEFVRMPPPQLVGSGLNFLKLDPEPSKVPGADTRDKRPPGPALFG